MQSSRWRLFVLSVVLGFAPAAPAGALPAARTNLPLSGGSTGSRLSTSSPRRFKGALAIRQAVARSVRITGACRSAGWSFR
jgi:hypothetical protein